MLQVFTPVHRRRTLELFVLAGGLAIAAAMVGLDDNPPGLLLALFACMAAVAAFVHPWRAARAFGFLAGGSVLGFGLFAVLHNVFEAVAGQSPSALATYVLQPLGVIAFFVALLLCPAGLLVGIIGAFSMFVRGRRHSPGSAV